MRIGSAPDNDIMPVGAGVDPHHVAVTAAPSGLLLTVLPGCQRVYVNARAVREKALLHYGDTVTLGANKFLLVADAAPAETRDVGDAVAYPGQAGLRIMSGAASGQLLPIAPELRLGAGSRHFGDLSYACRVAQTEDGLVFESESAAPRVNGWRCQRARLSPDDQIVLGEHRFVVEAPGLQCAAHAIAQPAPVAPVPEPEPDDSPHTEIWWLIGAAVVLAGLIALFLYFRW
ncbi:MAG TPA: FHA domain-containing protein [Rhodanobacteraceae bacterium]|nr:FHA domain-containing protein [Rhodanobacteraceae bacterium]